MFQRSAIWKSNNHEMWRKTYISQVDTWEMVGWSRLLLQLKSKRLIMILMRIQRMVVVMKKMTSLLLMFSKGKEKSDLLEGRSMTRPRCRCRSKQRDQLPKLGGNNHQSKCINFQPKSNQLSSQELLPATGRWQLRGKRWQCPSTSGETLGLCRHHTPGW